MRPKTEAATPLREQLVLDTEVFIEHIGSRFGPEVNEAARKTVLDLTAGKPVTVSATRLAESLAGTGADLEASRVDRTHTGAWTVHPDGSYSPA